MDEIPHGGGYSNETSSTVLSYGAILFFSFFLIDEIETFLSSFDFDYFRTERIQVSFNQSDRDLNLCRLCGFICSVYQDIGQD